MSEENGYSGVQVLLAFLAGAVTGACVALLAAPQSGTETRGAIRGWARDAGGKATRLPEALRRAYREATHAARQAFNQALAEHHPDRD